MGSPKVARCLEISAIIFFLGCQHFLGLRGLPREKLRSTLVVLVNEPQQFRCIDQMDSSSMAEILAFCGEFPARDEDASGEVLGEQPIEPASDSTPTVPCG